MDDIENNLKRFIDAQNSSYDRALNEIRNGRKLSHWMWYIFPQYEGLGRSEISKEYSIKSKEEAIEYFNHDILGKRLIEITQQFVLLENKTANAILGRPDDFKMNSCMTLFHLIQDETEIFMKVLEKYYNGKMCRKTSNLISKKNKNYYKL